MAYTKTNWQDRIVEFPNRYILQDNGDGTYTLIPQPGNVTQQGTALSATNMNKIESGIEAAHTNIDNHVADTNNPHNVTPAQIGAVNKAGDTMTGNLDMSDNNLQNVKFIILSDNDTDTYHYRIVENGTTGEFEIRKYDSGGTLIETLLQLHANKTKLTNNTLTLGGRFNIAYNSIQDSLDISIV